MNGKKITAFMVFVSILLCACLALSGFTVLTQIRTAKVIDDFFNTTTTDVNQEDDITISDNYTIKSTLKISDAYKSGDTSNLNDSEKETLEMAKEVLDEIITKNMNDFEKEKAVYDWLTSKLKAKTGILTVIPITTGNNDNPHDVLKNRSAVCVGYATTFRMFMQMLDIDCKVVHSTSLSHTWDLVKLDDGWYHTDCYMDSEACNYQNFNMDDVRCAQGHEWTREYFPAATGKKYNYIFYICDKLEDIYEIPAWLTNALIEKKATISCTFKNEINRSNEKEAQFMVEQLINQLGSNDSYSISYDWVLNDNSQYVLCFYIAYYEDTADIDKKTEKKIYQSISEAMDKYYEKTARG